MSNKYSNPAEERKGRYMPPSIKGTFTPSKPKDTTNEQRTRNTFRIFPRSLNLYGLCTDIGLPSNRIIRS